MSDTGVKYPATVSTVKETGDDNDWTNSSNVGADDAAYAYIDAATFDTPDTSYLLKATNFSMGVPAGAVINGILVAIERYCDSNERCNDVDVCLTKDGSARVGDDKSTGAIFSIGTPATVSFGGAADLWNTTWTAAEVNATTFGVLYKMQATDANADGYVDFIRVTVYYTVSAQTYYQDVIATAIGSPLLSRALSFYRTLPATAIGIPVLTKGLWLDILATALGNAVLDTTLIISRTLTAVGQGVASLTKVATYQQVLSAVVTGVVDLTKTATHYLTIGVTATGVVALTKMATHYISLVASATSIPQLLKGISKTLSATAIGQATLTKSTFVNLVAISQGVAGLTTRFIAGSITIIRGWWSK